MLTHWGYFGEVPPFAAGGQRQAVIRRYGVEAKADFRQWQMWAGAMLGYDRDTVAKEARDSLTGFVEIAYRFISDIFPMYMYQYQQADASSDPIIRHDIGVVALPLENMRWRLHYGYTPDGVANETVQLQMLLGF